MLPVYQNRKVGHDVFARIDPTKLQAQGVDDLYAEPFAGRSLHLTERFGWKARIHLENMLRMCTRYPKRCTRCRRAAPSVPRMVSTQRALPGTHSSSQRVNISNQQKGRYMPLETSRGESTRCQPMELPWVPSTLAVASLIFYSRSIRTMPKIDRHVKSITIPKTTRNTAYVPRLCACISPSVVLCDGRTKIDSTID